MKYVIGVLATALVLFVATYFLLRIWDINLLSPENFSKLMYSILIIVVTAVVLIVAIIIPFFGGNKRGYDQRSEGIAQKKIR